VALNPVQLGRDFGDGVESVSRDYEFSRKSIDQYIAQGYLVTAKTLAKRPMRA
jgi:hypothetical protein